MTTIVNISGYKFIHLRNLTHIQQRLKQHCIADKLKGTILLSEEGININLAGRSTEILRFKTFLATQNDLAGICFKESYSEIIPFKKMSVKIKKEIIMLGTPTAPATDTQQHSISPKQLKQWLDEGKPLTLFDTRNNYETLLGTFNSAVTLNINFFSELPSAIQDLTSLQDQKPVVMFCTGGIRCEKVLPLLLQQGLQSIYQLEGGILNYFAECGGSHYQGECFVFDERIALNSQLEVSGAVLCFVCQQPVSVLEQDSDHFQQGKFCPRCVDKAEGRLPEKLNSM